MRLQAALGRRRARAGARGVPGVSPRLLLRHARGVDQPVPQEAREAELRWPSVGLALARYTTCGSRWESKSPLGIVENQGTKQGIIAGTEYMGSVEITRHDELALEHNNPDLYPSLIVLPFGERLAET